MAMIGIDLGTSNSAAAVLRGGRPAERVTDAERRLWERLRARRDHPKD